MIEHPVFIGFNNEYIDFCKEIGRMIDYIETEDIFEMAELIRNCKTLHCNQSVALTLAQGMGVDYWLERNPGRTNALFKTPNERIL
jgi:hypothetical protein